MTPVRQKVWLSRVCSHGDKSSPDRGKLIWVDPVVLGGVVHPSVDAAQHVAFRKQTQPEVGGRDALPANVALRGGEELAQVCLVQSVHTGGHVLVILKVSGY